MLNKLIKAISLLQQNITGKFTSLLSDKTLNLISIFRAKHQAEVIIFIPNNNVNEWEYKCVNVNVKILHLEGVNLLYLFRAKQ